MMLQFRRSRLAAFLGLISSVFTLGVQPSERVGLHIVTEQRMKRPRVPFFRRARDFGSDFEQARRVGRAEAKRVARGARNLQLVKAGGFEQA